MPATWIPCWGEAYENLDNGRARDTRASSADVGRGYIVRAHRVSVADLLLRRDDEEDQDG